eukprot:194834-Hanusia_phi.AAC.1
MSRKKVRDNKSVRVEDLKDSASLPGEERLSTVGHRVIGLVRDHRDYLGPFLLSDPRITCP